MRCSSLGVLAGAVAAAFVASQAAAAVVTTYRGTVNHGLDTTGVFGAAGSVLDGLPFVAVFITDGAAPGASNTQGATSSSIIGGPPTPPVTGTITIKGITEFFGGDAGFQTQSDNGSFESFTHFASNHVSGSNFGSLMAGGSGTGLDFLPGPDWRTFPGADLDLVATLFGSFNIFEEDEETEDLIRRAQGTLTVTSVSVPEPQAWALMILGFAGVGMAIRHRRRYSAA